jgi:hypothetical protein
MNRPDGKVTPEVLQSILLDEVAGKLSDVIELLKQQIPSGHIVSSSVFVTDEPVEVNLGLWVKTTLYNDGPDDIYVYNNRQFPSTQDAALKMGDSLPVDKGRRTAERFYLVCASGGTATVRIFHI